MGRMRNAYTILVGKPEGRDHSEDLGVDEKIILEWIVGKNGGKKWTGCIWLKTGPEAGCCEDGNERSSFLKCGDFSLARRS
jgi:hypothetical protein